MIKNLLLLPAFSYCVLAQNQLEDLLVNRLASGEVCLATEESYVSEAANADRVTSLPVIGELPDETFSGFIDISDESEDKNVYYMF